MVTRSARNETRTLSDTVRKERFEVADTTDVDTDVEVDEPVR